MPYQNSTDSTLAARTSRGAHDPVVLSIGYAHDLHVRNELLSNAGYEVYAAANRHEAEALLSQQSFAAVIIGHAVPESDRLAFIEAARRMNPDAIIVLLYWDSIRRAEKADAILCIGNGPLALVQALRDLMGQ